MILQSLVKLYDNLAQDPKADIASYGFTEGKVSWCVVVNDDGELVALENVEALDNSPKPKMHARTERVPDCGKRTSGVSPNVLCDGSAYLFGYIPVGKKKEDDREKTLYRAGECFDAFRARHLSIEKQVNHPSFSAVCRFLERWKPADAESNAILAARWPEIAKATGMFVFRRDVDNAYVHKIPEVVDAWRRIKAAEDTGSNGIVGRCLVTNELGTLEEVHPSIKGVRDAQSSGAAIISFNASAFISYGKKQSLNAPVGKLAAFKYTTALNWLLSQEHRQCVQIGDASTVYWCDAKTLLVPAFGQLIGARQSQDESLLSTLKGAMEYLRGTRAGLPDDLGNAKSPFYVLGLAPNAARISIRFWYESTLGEAYEHLKQHYADLRIERQYGEGTKHPDSEFPAPWQLLSETARESKDIPSILNGELMRSILTGQKYPEAYLAALVRRIAADHTVNYLRASGIKAVLTRNHAKKLHTKIAMSLDLNCKDTPYLLGRLFAALEKAQSDSAPEIKATIKDRFFSSASATPAFIFPRLIQLNQHHMRKLKAEKFGSYVTDDKLIASISDDLGITEKVKGFPKRQSLQDQGVFAIGYYHQRNDCWRSKKDKAGAATEDVTGDASDETQA